MRSCATKYAVVDAVFLNMDDARETISLLVSDLSLEIHLVRGRLAPTEALLKLELRGEAANLAQGVRRLARGGGGRPSWARAS
jgi:hypothetical protein